MLATKFRFTMGDGPNRSGASRYRIVKCCEDSLRRLKTDRIDLYQIHMQDITVPEEETLRALDDLVRAGKILYVGCSNYAAYRLMNSLWLARAGHLSGYVTLQAQYSLLVRDLEREHVPLCREEGLGILPWSPLASGFLTGKFQQGQPPHEGTRLGAKAERFARYDLPPQLADPRRRARGRERARRDPGGGQPRVAARSKPQVTSVIFGARTIEQLEANLAAVELELSPAARAAARRRVGVRARLPVRVHPGDAEELVVTAACAIWASPITNTVSSSSWRPSTSPAASAPRPGCSCTIAATARELAVERRPREQR